MAPAVVLLRAVNLGPGNRSAMPSLRDAFGDAGLENARTYVQSANIVVDTDLDEAELAQSVEMVSADVG